MVVVGLLACCCYCWSRFVAAVLLVMRGYSYWFRALGFIRVFRVCRACGVYRLCFGVFTFCIVFVGVFLVF